MYGYVYKTTCIINDKIYIGKHGKNIFNAEYLGSGKLLHLAINKYGVENFKTEVIVWCCSLEQLNESEIYWINYYKNNNTNGFYNIARGGTGGNTLAYSSEVDKLAAAKKQSETLKKIYKNKTIEQRQKANDNISKAKKGKIPNMNGYKHSEETKRKIAFSNRQNHIDNAEWFKKVNIKIDPSKIPQFKLGSGKCKKIKIGPNIFPSIKSVLCYFNISYGVYSGWRISGKLQVEEIND